MNILRKLTLFSTFIIALSASAQMTTISTTGVIDSDSTTWANGTWNIQFRPSPSNPNVDVYNLGGAPLSSAILYQKGGLDGSGIFTVTIYDSSRISPSGSGWTLQICPLATSACGNYIFSSTGSTEDLTTAINSSIDAPRFNALAGAYGYVDVEAHLTIPQGGTYWSNNNNCQRYFNTLTSTWSCAAGGTPFTYPPAGIPCSTGSSWCASYAHTGTGNVTLNNNPTLTGNVLLQNNAAASQFITFQSGLGAQQLEGVCYDTFSGVSTWCEGMGLDGMATDYNLIDETTGQFRIRATVDASGSTQILSGTSGGNYSDAVFGNTNIQFFYNGGDPGAGGSGQSIGMWDNKFSNQAWMISGLGAEQVNTVQTFGGITSSQVATPVVPSALFPWSTTSGGSPGLAPSTTYYYQIVATQASDTLFSLPSAEMSITTGSGGTNSNTITWIPSMGASGFDVYRSTSSGAEQKCGSFTILNPQLTAEIIDTGAVACTGAAVPSGNTTGGVITTAGGTVPIFRCVTAGAARAGALTSVSADCGTFVATGLVTK